MATIAVLSAGEAYADITKDLVGTWKVVYTFKLPGETKEQTLTLNKKITRLKNGTLYSLIYIRERGRTYTFGQEWFYRNRKQTCDFIGYDAIEGYVVTEGTGHWGVKGRTLSWHYEMEDFDGPYREGGNLRRVNRNKWVGTTSNTIGTRQKTLMTRVRR